MYPNGKTTSIGVVYERFFGLEIFFPLEIYHSDFLTTLPNTVDTHKSMQRERPDTLQEHDLCTQIRHEEAKCLGYCALEVLQIDRRQRLASLHERQDILHADGLEPLQTIHASPAIMASQLGILHRRKLRIDSRFRQNEHPAPPPTSAQSPAPQPAHPHPSASHERY